MTLSDLGDLCDLLGGIGVVATLAYLAVQIRQNTQEVRSASLDAVAASHMEFQRSVWGDPVLSKLWFDGMAGVALPEDEGRQFLFMVITCARHWERAYHRARGGTLDVRRQNLSDKRCRSLRDGFSLLSRRPFWPGTLSFFVPSFDV